jgi:hypothetical protein
VREGSKGRSKGEREEQGEEECLYDTCGKRAY